VTVLAKVSDRRAHWGALAHRAEADVPAIMRGYQALLNGVTSRILEAVSEGADPLSLAGNALSGFSETLEAFETDIALEAAVRGYLLAGGLMGRKAFLGWRVLAKAAGAVAMEPGYGTDEQLANHLRPSIAAWVEQTSRHETATTAQQLDKYLKEAFTYQTPSGMGMTPDQVAAELKRRLTKGNKHRAEMLARTLSLWAYNEGAMALYRDEGVGAVEWMATEDDLTCPYCMAIDGAQMPTGELFGLAGDEIDGLEELGGGTMTLGFDTQHPPLHPHCRCILAPVVLASQIKG